MGRTIEKMAIWLIVAWSVSVFGHSGLSKDPPISLFGIMAIASLPYVSYRLAKTCDHKLLFLLFGCIGMAPFSLMLLNDWSRFPVTGSPFGSLLTSAIIPIIGMGLLCRAMPALRDFLSIEIPNPLCKQCGYNLTGNVSGICPECGKPVQSSLP